MAIWAFIITGLLIVLGYKYSKRNLKIHSTKKLLIWLTISVLSFSSIKGIRFFSIFDYSIFLSQILGGFAAGYAFYVFKRIINDKLKSV